MNTADAKRILGNRLDLFEPSRCRCANLRVLFDDELGADTIKSLLLELQEDWAQRGLELVSVGQRLALPESAGDCATTSIGCTPRSRPRYTRAACSRRWPSIAYRQPATRGDMEDIRGVTDQLR